MDATPNGGSTIAPLPLRGPAPSTRCARTSKKARKLHARHQRPWRRTGDRGFFPTSRKAGEALERQIYGIEPGNDGNRLILDMIEADAFGLGAADFDVVESSEQGCWRRSSARSTGASRSSSWRWEPHPMNANFDITYLTGRTDEWFGPDLGGANRLHQYPLRITSKGLPEMSACLLTNLVFTLEMENEIMGAILNDGADPVRGGDGPGCPAEPRDGHGLAQRRHQRNRPRRRCRSRRDRPGPFLDPCQPPLSPPPSGAGKSARRRFRRGAPRGGPLHEARGVVGKGRGARAGSLNIRPQAIWPPRYTSSALKLSPEQPGADRRPEGPPSASATASTVPQPMAAGKLWVRRVDTHRRDRERRDRRSPHRRTSSGSRRHAPA